MNRKSLAVALSLAVFATGSIAQAGFDSFVIRNGASGAPTIQPNNVYVPGATEFVIGQSGMKAALGSNDINGITVGDITQLTITRHDDTTRFSNGSGPAVAPYFNMWVTDGLGNYAVVANEPSNPAFQPLFSLNGDGSKTYDLDYTDLADKTVKVYETPGWNTNSSWIHNLFGSDPLTFSDIASLEISAPSAAYIQNGSNGVGSGAPDVLGTDVAYGFNWVFGDTLANYVSGMEGYVVSGFNVAPEPVSLTMLALGGLMVIRRRK